MSTPEPDHSEDDLGKVIQDFTRDVLTTFPECAESLDAQSINHYITHPL